MTYRLFWDDEAEIVLAYLSGEARFGHLAPLAEPGSRDPRFRVYNEIMLVQDFSGMFGKDTGVRVAKALGDPHGPDDNYLTSIVVRRDIDWGLKRVFNAHRDRAVEAFQIFNEFSGALDFVGVQDPVIRERLEKAARECAAEFGESLWF